ncbi:MAG: 50S ribosomal protein L7/L12 [Bacteroidota bacterium]|nr:50S ribosomal protein L7/L12 [Bacteroidota bacterium]MDE2834873.1 50S ribosomal protein L7/L12 [Bacteroidota bacterium]MDE2957324.1 50S ribosomal protein L7/L12 [Bacteroidota bacterium]
MADLKSLAEQLVSLTIREASELATLLETDYGIKPAASAAVVMPAGAGAAEEAATEEQTEFTVLLKSFGKSKIGVIKEVRAITGLGLKEAKAVVDGVPNAVKENVSKEEAEEVRTRLEAAGAEVEVQ